MKKIIFLLIVVPFMALAQSCSKNNDMQPSVHVSAGVSVGNGGYNNNGVIYPNDQLVWFNNQQVPMSTLGLGPQEIHWAIMVTRPNIQFGAPCVVDMNDDGVYDTSISVDFNLFQIYADAQSIWNNLPHGVDKKIYIQVTNYSLLNNGGTITVKQNNVIGVFDTRW